MSRPGKHPLSRHASLSLCHAEASMERRIPYSAHVAPEVVRTQAGDYVQAFRLRGVSHETADDSMISHCRDQLNTLWRSLASPQLAVWVHVVRRRAQGYPGGEFQSAFAQRLNARYRTRVEGEQLLVNELYLNVVYRPSAGVTQSLAARLLARQDPARSDVMERKDSLDACEKLRLTLLAALADYEPQALGVYYRGPVAYSTLLEFLGVLINGVWQPMPLPRCSLARALAVTRPVFGTEAMEYRTATHTRLAAFLGIKEYAASTSPAMFDALLRAPFEFVMTHSFTFLSQVAAQGVLQRKARQLESSGDFAASQAQELREALDAHASGEFAVGDHHASVQILTEAYAGIEGADSTSRIKALNDRIAEALPLLQASHLIIAREDLALESAYWAQLPGCFADRTRKATITSRNFACFAPLHGFPTGRLMGNYWGEAMALFPTSARTPYYFSLHASNGEDGAEGAGDNGHTFVCGPTGSGKTVFIGFLMTMLLKHQVTQIVIDKDRGLELLVRALDGEYLPLRVGERTGFNPLQLPDTPANIEFLKQWLQMLGEPQSPREAADLVEALRGTMRLRSDQRRLSRLVEFLDATEPNGVWARMARWCDDQRGVHAWVFDNPADLLVPRLGGPDLLGIDVTDLLASPSIRTPVTAYLMHLIGGLLDGRRLVCWMDEFSSLLDSPVFADFAKNGLRTWRKLDAVLVMCAQLPSDVINSSIARTLIEQVATRVFFPNRQGARADYVDGFGLSHREYQLIADEMSAGARQFLLKQGKGSAVCTLDLTGFHEELSVISGRARTVSLMRELIEQYGAQSADWLPVFLEKVRAVSRRVPDVSQQVIDACS